MGVCEYVCKWIKVGGGGILRKCISVRKYMCVGKNMSEKSNKYCYK